MDLRGKTIILTGAKRIGKTVASALGERGANLVVSYRSSKEEADFICQGCIGAGSKAISIQADLSKEEDIQNLVAAAVKEFGQVDGLVHMAANYSRVALKDSTMADFSQTQQIIGGSSLLLAKYVSEQLQKNTGDEVLVDGEKSGKVKGKMIFFSDWSVLKKPYTDYLAYNMAKAGINSLTIALAALLGPDITVNAIAPGPMLKPPDLTEEENQEALAGTPLNRWGGAQEIAKAVLYLLDSDFVTGVILPVDGGRTVG